MSSDSDAHFFVELSIGAIWVVGLIFCAAINLQQPFFAAFALFWPFGFVSCLYLGNRLRSHFGTQGRLRREIRRLDRQLATRKLRNEVEVRIAQLESSC